jgi:uncharacterized protein YsxB (DUF464 family)
VLVVTFTKDSRNRLSSVFAKGHAEANLEGDDLVCSAVSAILQAARLGLQKHAKVRIDVYQEPGNFSMRCPESRRGDKAVRAILATAELSIEQIASQYPANVRLVHTDESA